LEEIALTAKADFLKAGGREFHYLPAPNEAPDWIATLADITQGHLTGAWQSRQTGRDTRAISYKYFPENTR
jgi:ferrochelatase